MTRYTAPTLRARPVTDRGITLFWLASVRYAGHVFYVEGQYGSEQEALRAADKERAGIVRRCTPEYLAALDARSNEPSPGSRVVVVGGTE